jgi:hypothetical protein
VQPRFQVVRRDRERSIQHTLIVVNLQRTPPQKNQKRHRLRSQGSAINYDDDFELLELPALDLPEPASLDDELEELLLEEDEEESVVDAAGLLLPESGLLSEAAADVSAFPSDLPAESDEVAGLPPDLA